jgi:nucleoside-diphosphate-sugar epimerase
VKILVTGATGFVGQHVIPALLNRNHEVIALARNIEKAKEFNWFPQVDFVSYDIYSNKSVTLDELGNPDALLHLAWSDLTNYKSINHIEINLPSDFKFLKSLVEQGLKQLLITGTCFEYGMQNGCLNETMASNPSNSYALAKDTLRKFMENLQHSFSFNFQWVRLFYMYGKGQNPGSLLSQLDKAISNGEPVFNMSKGEQLRDYLPIEKVAENLIKIIETPSIKGIINCCSGNPISVRRLVEEHIAKSKSKIELNLGYYPYPDYEPLAFWGDNTKLSLIKN